MDADRAQEMTRATSEIDKRIATGTFDPMSLLMDRLEGQAYGYDKEGHIKKPTACSYVPPSDEITSRNTGE